MPELDYDYDPLEPHISGQINELHHSNHHAAYVKGANDALAKLEEARVSGDHSGIFAQLSRRKGSERAIQRPKSAAGQSE